MTKRAERTYADPFAGTKIVTNLQNGITRRAAVTAIVGLGGQIATNGPAVMAAIGAAFAREASAAMIGAQGFPIADQIEHEAPVVNALSAVPIGQRSAILDGTSNWDPTASMADFFANERNIVFPTGSVWRFGGTSELADGTLVNGYGATVAMMTNQTVLFDIRNKTGLRIKNLRHVGRRRDYNQTLNSSSMSRGYWADGSVDCRITNSHFLHFGYTPIFAHLSVDLWFDDNFVEGPGFVADGGCLYLAAGGVTGSKDNAGFVIGGLRPKARRNQVYRTAQGGIIVQGSIGAEVDDLVTDAIVEHALYCDTAMRDLTVRNVRGKSELSGIKVQWYDDYFEGGLPVTPKNIRIFDTDVDAGDQLINFNNASAGDAGVILAQNVLISGVKGRSRNASAISLRYTKDAVVERIYPINAGDSGIFLRKNVGATISDFLIKDTMAQGICDGGSNTRTTISNGKVVRPGQKGANNETSCGVFIAAGDWDFSNVQVLGDPRKTKYSLFWAGGDHANSRFADCEFSGAEEYGVRLTGPLQFRSWLNNRTEGALGESFNGYIPTSILASN